LLLTDTFLQKESFAASKTAKVSDYVKKVLSRFGNFAYLCIAKNNVNSL